MLWDFSRCYMDVYFFNANFISVCFLADFLPVVKTPPGLVGEEAASLPAPGTNNPLNMSLKHPLIELQWVKRFIALLLESEVFPVCDEIGLILTKKKDFCRILILRKPDHYSERFPENELNWLMSYEAPPSRLDNPPTDVHLKMILINNKYKCI